MSTTPAENDTLNVVQRIALAEAEPQKPTEAAEVVTVSDEAPEEVTTETESTDEVVETKAEESETVAEEPTPEADESEELYVEIDGREINLKDIKDWEQGNLRQSDYTRKTTELADQRKTFESEREAFNDQQGQLAGSIATLEAIIAEDALTDEAVKDLREYEPEEYIKYKEKQDNRKKALSDAKTSQPVSTVDVEQERVKLWDANPSWVENGKPTEAHTKDMDMLNSYFKASGYTSDEIAGITSARHWQTLLEAAKYRSVSTKNAAIEKKVRKAPVTTKPRASTTTGIDDEIKAAQAKLKASGKTEDAYHLRQLRRKKSNG